MTEQQKRAAATISFGIIVVGAVLLSVLAIQVGASMAPLGRHFAGRDFILLAYTQTTVGVIIKALPPIISIGLSIVAGARLKDWQYYGTVAITIIGILTCIYLVMQLADPDQAKRFWAYSPIQDIYNYATFTAATRPLLVALGAWFVAVLAIQLGVSGSKQTQGGSTASSPTPSTPPPAAQDAPPASADVPPAAAPDPQQGRKE